MNHLISNATHSEGRMGSALVLIKNQTSYHYIHIAFFSWKLIVLGLGACRLAAASLRMPFTRGVNCPVLFSPNDLHVHQRGHVRQVLVMQRNTTSCGATYHQVGGACEHRTIDVQGVFYVQCDV